MRSRLDRFCRVTHKRRYATKLLALLENEHLPLPSAYRCPHCGDWHITRRADVADLAHEIAEAA